MATSTISTQQSPPQPSSPPPQQPQQSQLPLVTTESTAENMVNKRYEGLIMVRTKAIKGKGAWYWSHLEPVLVNNPKTGSPKAVKLRCCLCAAVFSASNPSRTASEHLKNGTCPSFHSDLSNPNPIPKPISSISPTGMLNLSSSTSSQRKRSSGNRNRTTPPSTPTTYSVAPITMIEPARFSIDGSFPNRPGSGQDTKLTRPGSGQDTKLTRPSSGSGYGYESLPALPALEMGVSSSGLFGTHQQQYHQLSGGKDDFGALAMLEDSVKKLKSPKTSQPSQTLTKSQINSSLKLLTDWVYENCGSVSFSSINHPKFKSFLTQIGLPEIPRRELAGERLEFKYQIAKTESEARIRDAMFFQVSSNGWKSKKGEKLVNLSVNLPNGTSVFRKGVFANGYVFSKYAEEVLMETVVEICGHNLQQCVGIVSDKFKFKALKNLENRHQWMINLSCQFQGVSNLIKDFTKELPLFKNVIDSCYKVANFINTTSQIRNFFLKYQFQESGRARLLRVPFGSDFEYEFDPVFNMVEDLLTSARTLQLVLLDESYQKVSIENQTAREIEETMRNPQFWREIEVVHSLIKLVKTMASEIEKERPRIGQCLPLWEELRVKIKEWCLKFQMNENLIGNVFEKRFKRNYHPAWAAAFILDPFYLIRDRSGKYLPPFKCLTSEQEKDVDKLITRLVSREEAHIALMELMKWRTDGLDPVYAQAVQLKQRDPVTGKMKIANPQSSRLVWETYLTDFNSLRKVAVRLIFLHATSCGFKCNWSLSKLAQSSNSIDKAQKLIFIAAHSRLDDDKDADFFTMDNGDDNEMVNEVMFDASSQ